MLHTIQPDLCPDYDEDAHEAEWRAEADRYALMTREEIEAEDLYERAHRQYAPLTPIELLPVWPDPFADDPRGL